MDGFPRSGRATYTFFSGAWQLGYALDLAGLLPSCRDRLQYQTAVRFLCCFHASD